MAHAVTRRGAVWGSHFLRTIDVRRNCTNHFSLDAPSAEPSCSAETLNRCAPRERCNLPCARSGFPSVGRGGIAFLDAFGDPLQNRGQPEKIVDEAIVPQCGIDRAEASPFRVALQIV